MRKSWAFVALVIAGCGGGTDYLGQSPEESAADLAEMGCGVAFDCGVYEIDCDPPTATLRPAEEIYGSQAACESDLADYYADLFAGCAAANLTDDQKDTLNDCLNSGSRSCLSEAEAAEWAEAVCIEGSGALDEVCRRALPVLELCSACANDPADC
jgi:hypothetical protein